MKILIYCWLVALTVPLLGQTAKVIALTPNETARAKQLKMDQENLTIETHEFELMIKHEYLMTSPPANAIPNTIYNGCSGNNCWSPNWKPGWGNNGEFEYSDDYRFIVPAKVLGNSGVINITPGGSWWNGCYQTTPNYGGWYATPTSVPITSITPDSQYTITH